LDLKSKNKKLIKKYILIRHRHVDIALGDKLSTSMTDLLEYFLPIFCISNILFITILTNNKLEVDITS